MLKKVISNHFDYYTILENISDGINSSCIFTSDNQKYVCKVFTSNRIDTESYIASVKLVMNTIQNTDTNTPNIEYTGDYDGDVYIIYEYIDGDIWSYDNLYGKQTEHKEYIEDVAEIITQIQNIQNPVDKFGWYTVKDDTLTVSDEYDTMKGMVLSYLDYNFDQLSRQITQQYYDQIYEYISSHLGYNGPPVIGHCDIKYDNIIVSDKKWLIDWEFPRSIDPMYEFVKTERQLINQYNYYDEYDQLYNSELARDFKTTYFEQSDREYNALDYKSYRLQELIECLRACDNWFNEEEVPNVKSYYENQINRILNE